MSNPGGNRSRSARVMLPLLLFAGMVGVVVLLAVLHPAKPGVPKAVAGSTIELGARQGADRPRQGRDAGRAGVGPALAGRNLAEELVRMRIAQGKGAMPSGLVAGADADAVVEYLRSVGAVG